MNTPKKPVRLNFFVQEGSALERLLANNPNRKPSLTIHEVVAAYEAKKEKR